MSTWRKTLTATLMLGISHLGVAWAAEPAGTAAALNPDVAASGAGGKRPLAIGNPVYMGDVLKTDARGTAEIRFVDNTRLAVGPNSNITIDRFVFGGGNTAKQVVLNVAQGGFRFLTGISAKSAYSIQTPTATIGVRGTEWEGIYVDGVLKVVLYDGSVRVCTKTSPRRCTVLSQPCDMLTVSQDGQFDRPRNVYDKTDMLENEFAFAFREHRLLPDFRAKSGSCNNPNYDPPSRANKSDSLPPPTHQFNDGDG